MAVAFFAILRRAPPRGALVCPYRFNWCLTLIVDEESMRGECGTFFTGRLSFQSFEVTIYRKRGGYECSAVSVAAISIVSIVAYGIEKRSLHFVLRSTVHEYLALYTCRCRSLLPTGAVGKLWDFSQTHRVPLWYSFYAILRPCPMSNVKTLWWLVHRSDKYCAATVSEAPPMNICILMSEESYLRQSEAWSLKLQGPDSASWALQRESLCFRDSWTPIGFAEMVNSCTWVRLQILAKRVFAS